MALEKLELIEKLETKGMTIAEAAQAMEFDAQLLSLYLVKDAMPVPKRILEKLEKVVVN